MPRTAPVWISCVFTTIVLTGSAVADPGTTWTHTPADLRKASLRAPKDPQRALDLAKNLDRAGLHRDALRVLRNVYFRAKGAPLNHQVRLAGARSIMARGKYKAAIAECKHLKAMAPAKHAACNIEAQLTRKRVTLAEPQGEQAVKRFPQDYDVRVAYGRTLVMAGKLAAAKAELKQAEQLDGARYEAYWHLGRAAALEKDNKTAAQLFSTALAKAPFEVPVLLDAAELEGASDAGIARLKLAVSVRPGSKRAQARLGAAHLERGEPKRALAALKEATRGRQPKPNWLVWHGQALLESGQVKQALKMSQAALKRVKNHGAARLLYADALAAKGDVDRAIPAYEEAWAYGRKNPAPLVRAAQACLTGSRPTTARAFADLATSEFPKHGPAWLVAGDVAVVQKEKRTARKAYRKALKLGGVDKAAVNAKLAKLPKPKARKRKKAKRRRRR